MKFATKMLPLALLALSAGAWADGAYVLGAVTHSRTSLGTATDDNALNAAGASGLATSDHGNGNQWRLQLGYGFTPNFALEAGYIDFGKAKYSASYTGGSAAGTVKAGGLDLAALGILPLTDSFSVFGKLGVVAAKVKDSLSASGPGAAASGNTSAHVVRPLYGLGASYKLSDAMDVRLEYDRAGNLGKSGKTDKLTSNMISVGLAYHF